MTHSSHSVSSSSNTIRVIDDFPESFISFFYTLPPYVIMKVHHCHGQLLDYTTRDWHELYFTPKVISDPSGFFPRLIWSTFTQGYHRSSVAIQNRGNNVLGLDSRLQPDWTFVKTYKVGQRHDVSCRGTATAANNNNNTWTSYFFLGDHFLSPLLHWPHRRFLEKIELGSLCLCANCCAEHRVTYTPCAVRSCFVPR